MVMKESIDNIRSLKLTQWGKEMLKSFDVKAIDYADENFNPGIHVSFNDFVSLCSLYSKQHRLPIKWTELYDVKNAIPAGEYPVHREPKKSGSSARSHSSQRNLIQQGGKVSFYNNEPSREYLEKLRKSEERYPTQLHPWQTKPPHDSLFEKSLGEDGKPVAITYDDAMSQIKEVEDHATQPISDTLKLILGRNTFDANIKSQCERIMSLIDYDLKERKDE